MLNTDTGANISLCQTEIMQHSLRFFFLLSNKIEGEDIKMKRNTSAEHTRPNESAKTAQAAPCMVMLTRTEQMNNANSFSDMHVNLIGN